MKLNRIVLKALRGNFLLSAITLTTILVFSLPLGAQEYVERLKVGIGHSRVLELKEPVNRVSVADPEIADATVTTPLQVLVNGKKPGSTTLIVWNEKDHYKYYEVIVLSTASTDQVRLKVRFAEVKTTAIRELGVNFLLDNHKVSNEKVTLGSFGGKVSSPSVPLMISENVDLLASVPTQDVSAIVHALEEKRLLTTLANPSLSATNGGEASFLAGGEFPIPMVQGTGTQPMVSIIFKEFGIRMRFTPTVVDSNLVNIKVLAEVSSLDFANGIELSGFRIPSLQTRRSETTVELGTGKYMVIGGLVSSEMISNMGRVPLLGKIPIISYLFSSQQFQKNETELIVLITPVIIRGGMSLPSIIE